MKGKHFLVIACAAVVAFNLRAQQPDKATPAVKSTGKEKPPQLASRQSLSDMERFRSNVIDFYTGKGADPKDPLFVDALRRLEKEAESYLQSMIDKGAEPGLFDPP